MDELLRNIEGIDSLLHRSILDFSGGVSLAAVYPWIHVDLFKLMETAIYSLVNTGVWTLLSL
jgi:hypothetical protein